MAQVERRTQRDARDRRSPETGLNGRGNHTGGILSEGALPSMYSMRGPLDIPGRRQPLRSLDLPLYEPGPLPGQNGHENGAVKSHENGSSTKHGKEAIANGRDGMPLTPELMEDLFPHAAVIIGTPGETGTIVRDDEGNTIGAAPHPRWVLDESGETVDVKSGGRPTTKHLQEYRLRRVDAETSERLAQRFLFELIYGKRSLLKGSEDEGWRLNVKTNQVEELPDHLQDELHRGLWEIALPARETIEATWLDRIELKETIAKQLPEGVIHGDFSVPPIGSLEQGNTDSGLLINNGHMEKYVGLTSQNTFDGLDYYSEEVRQVMDQLGWTFKYKDGKDMIQTIGNITPLVFGAGHRSQGMAHYKDRTGRLVVPEDHAIEAVHVATSTLYGLEEILTLNSPVILGQSPKVWTRNDRDEMEEVWPRDYRVLIKELSLNTAAPEMIKDGIDLQQRLVDGMYEGRVGVLDRAPLSHEQTVKGKKEQVHSLWGPARLRAAVKKAEIPDMGKKIQQLHEAKGQKKVEKAKQLSQELEVAQKAQDEPMVRIEHTAPPSSYSVYDEYAANCMAEIGMYAVYLAKASGKTVEEMFGKIAPSLVRNDDRQSVVRGYNFFGMEHAAAEQVRQEGIVFATVIGEALPHLKPYTSVVVNRLENLVAPTKARNFKEYYYKYKSQGQVSMVAQNMLKAGKSPAEVAEQAIWYQRKAMRDLKRAKGHAAVALGLMSEKEIQALRPAA